MQELIINENNIKDKIHNIRNQQVMLDRDLAELYGVKPIRLREQVKRNIDRFPDDFLKESASTRCFNSMKKRLILWYRKMRYLLSNI